MALLYCASRRTERRNHATTPVPADLECPARLERVARGGPGRRRRTARHPGGSVLGWPEPGEVPGPPERDVLYPHTGTGHLDRAARRRDRRRWHGAAGTVLPVLSSRPAARPGGRHLRG